MEQSVGSINTSGQIASLPKEEQETVPVLRDDLSLISGPDTQNGSPTWTIYDPVRGRYFRIDHLTFELLARWHLREPEAILNSVSENTLLSPKPTDLEQLVRFLNVNSLVIGNNIDGLMEQVKATKRSWWSWLMHNYLFFRIPVIKPDKFLNRSVKWTAPLFSQVWFVVLLCMGALGLFLVGRQWDAFLTTFMDFFSWDGAIFFAIALVGTKILHEFGHAYAAKRYGCRVPTMGVAFLVLWPVLYTDTTDGYRLTSRNQRLQIASAGIFVELSLAIIATLLWSFLPDGPARSAAFMVATVTWVSTLVINLNPFMRFDGYYLLADAMDMPNLQDRSFALAKWWVRETLFGLNAPPPEIFSRKRTYFLVIYAFATWVYRLILFIGIAVLVYQFFIKIIGILLFIIEILWFIARPIWNEMKVWWLMRTPIFEKKRLYISLLGFFGLIALTLIPLETVLHEAAVFQPFRHTTVFTPAPARIETVEVKPGQTVKKGDILIQMTSPQLSTEVVIERQKAKALEARLSRQATNEEDRDRARIVQEQLSALLTKIKGLEAWQERLILRAPFDGVVTEIIPGARPGRWISINEAVIHMIDPKETMIEALIPEKNIMRVLPNVVAVFYPDDPEYPSVKARVSNISDVNLETLESPYLASLYGGEISVERNEKGQLVPINSLYKVLLKPDTTLPPPQGIIRGSVRIEAEPASLAGRFFRLAAGVLIRESGF